MPQIPSAINGVTVEFAPAVVNNVDQKLIDGLKHCVKTDVADGHSLTKIFISSAFDQHQAPSRHMQHKAVDISRINGVKIAIGYPQGGAVQAIVNAMQEKFESYVNRRENFGPHFKKKNGADWTVSGHDDHVHFSVN